MLDEASTLELFDGVRQDIVLLSLASYLTELAEAVCAEETVSPEILSLLLNALYALCYLGKEPRLVKAAYQFRLLALAGFEPLASACAVCGREAPEAPMLDVLRGVVHCGGCKQPGGLSMPLTAAAWRRCGISCTATAGGCTPSRWSLRRCGSWITRGRPSPPASWSGAFGHWTTTNPFWGNVRTYI